MSLPKKTLPFVFHFSKKQPWKFSFLILTAIIWAINDSLYPYFLKHIVNELAPFHGSYQEAFIQVAPTLGLLICFWIFSEIMMRIQGVLQIYIFPILRAQMRNAVFDSVTLQSQDYFASHFSGDIAKKLSDIPTSSQTILETICVQLIAPFTFASIVLFMMYHVSPIFSVFLSIWLIIHFSIVMIFLVKNNRYSEIHADSVSLLSGKIVDTFSNMLSVKLFSRRQYESEYLSHFQQDEIRKSKRANWVIEIMRVILGLNGLFLIFSMIIALVYCYAQGVITIGDFTQVGMQTLWVLGWMWYVSFQLSILSREMGTVNAALALVSTPPSLVDIKDAGDIHIEGGEIVFDRMGFHYHVNRPIFQNLNLIIRAGEKVGLVGFSGAGKSTLVNLIMRFYDVKSGAILIDGQNIGCVKQESLRSQIAMIPQEPQLFHRSLFENIRYGRLEATEAEVIAAAKLAHCHEFIEKLDQGYHTIVGERGVKLSGGQRQRIAIARAILKNAPILILDEATSALDSVTEKKIQESLRLLMHLRTTIVVAHRLSTLENMDRILVFHQGKLIEQGSHQELLNAKGHFAMLWEKQAGGFLRDDHNDDEINEGE